MILKLMSKKEKQLSKPSEEFKLAIGHVSSIEILCELCGRGHFSADENSFEEGEFEKLLKKHEENPDKYIFHSDEDSVIYGYINGKQAVVDCPCNELSKYETFFWNHRYIIEEYFTARANKELEDAKENKDLADKVKTSIK